LFEKKVIYQEHELDNMSRGQVSTEAFFVIIVMFLVFGMIIFNYMSNNKEQKELKEGLDIKELCTSLSNLIYSVYKSGHGTTANFSTNKIVTIFGNGSIAIQDILNITTEEKKIAILVSEAGETTQTFYDLANAQLHPDWYKNCFSDIGSSGCQSSGSDVNYALIPNNLSNLIANINNYDVMYLEDAHIQYNAQYGGSLYTNIIRDWVYQGHSLILSEHFFCREITSNPPAGSTSYQCNPPGSNSDVWTLFNMTFNQEGGNGYSGNDVIVIRDDPLFDLTIGQQFDFEEHSFLEEIINSNRIESESGSFAGGFGSTTSCQCSSPSGGYCIRHTGSTSVPANATYTSAVSSGKYNLTVRFCGENDGNDQWWVYVNNTIISSWNTTYSSSWQDRVIQNVTINTGQQIKLKCDRGTSNSYCRSDYIRIANDAPLAPLTVIANYTNAAISDSRLKPAIGYWTYGAGTVYYFGDFQVAPSQQSQYSQVIADLIQVVVLMSVSDRTTICNTPVNVDFYQLSNNIVIKNVNNRIVMYNTTT
jgi:hypothetical protein